MLVRQDKQCIIFEKSSVENQGYDTVTKRFFYQKSKGY
jgi:hypothetical protein